ncbi:MAG TPA: diguanylate cyclase [Ideonella sp.]|uniref:diguanylate cyclase domain-containing protein n=1 Tax=Ideonella sp. TaxID=1929293 RepID=UPI002C9983B3|nr:diguanylate cyclase [Ideonella sp.]HSI46935.1 diguanylate cyclase [Ideonella sp.]
MDRRPPSFDPQSRTWLELGEVQRLLLDSYPGLVLGLDLDGRIRWLNPAGAERLGRGREELSGRELAGNLMALEELEVRAAQLSRELGERIPADASVLSARLQRGFTDEHEWVLRHKDGSPQPTRLALGTLRDHQGSVVGLIAVEPAQRDDDEARLQLTHHDSLTGLPTRAVLPDRAEMAIQRAARQHSVVAFMLVELTGFEALCETHGHSVGDDVLRATASRLHFELRKTDTAVRLDGGQFAAMLVDLHHADEATLVANKIAQALSAPVNVGVARIPLSARIGVAWFPSHGDQLLPLLQAAEAALASVSSEAGGVACAPLAGD